MGKISFSRKSLGIPYALFLVLFVVAPLFVLIYYAFTNGQGQFTLANMTGFFCKSEYLGNVVLQLCDFNDNYGYVSYAGLSNGLYSGKE